MQLIMLPSIHSDFDNIFPTFMTNKFFLCSKISFFTPSQSGIMTNFLVVKLVFPTHARYPGAAD